MIIDGFQPFTGHHCETTATGCLLKHIGIELSEPMLFGLGEGLGFIYWKMKQMDFPFIGGRVKPGALTRTLLKHLDLDYREQQTGSPKKAWKNIQDSLGSGRVAGLQLDCYHLEYFTTNIHFAGHFVAMYGYDEQYAYLVDTQQQGGQVKTLLPNLAAARSEKGHMAAKNLLYTVQKKESDYLLSEILPAAITTAIENNAREFLNPPIKNIGYKGILKASMELKKHFYASDNTEHDFCTIAMLMERAGTGGALFRNFYRDFLHEACAITKSEAIKTAHSDYCEIAKRWTRVAELLDQAGRNNDEKSVLQACDLMLDLSDREHVAMKGLEEIT